VRERLNAIAELARVARRSWESLGTSDRWRGGRREPVALRPRLSPGVPSRASRPTLRGGPKDVKNSPGLRFKAEQVCSISSSSYRQPWTPSPWLARRRFSSCMPSWTRWQSPPPAVLAATWLSWLASCECHRDVLGRPASRRSGSGQRSGGVGHTYSPQLQRDPRGVRRTELVLLPGDLCRCPHDDGSRLPTAGDFTDWN